MQRFIFMLAMMVLLVGFLSCQVASKPGKISENDQSDDMAGAITSLSIEFSHALGMEIEQKDSGYFVKLISETGPAGISGIKNGDKISSIAGVNMQDLDEEKKVSIVDELLLGSISVSIVGGDDITKTVKIPLTISNSPQHRTSDFIFISEPGEYKQSSLLIVQVDRGIEKVTFDHYAVNRFWFYDGQTGRWDASEKSLPFDTSVNMNSIEEFLDEDFKIIPPSQDNSGMLIHHGDSNVEFKYLPAKEYEIEGATFIGEGILTFSDMEIEGKSFVRHMNEFFINPFYREIKRLEFRDMTSDTRHIEDYLGDWILLFDKSGNMVELLIDGVHKRWKGALYPGNSIDSTIPGFLDGIPQSNGIIDIQNFDMTWFDDFIKEYESYPFPVDITLVLTISSDLLINLDSVTPCYDNDGFHLYTALNGKVTKDDGTVFPVSGFMQRENNG